MAPAVTSDPVSQADTPMTDTNDDTMPSVPVDSADAQMTVRNNSSIQYPFFYGLMATFIFVVWVELHTDLPSQFRATERLQITP